MAIYEFMDISTGHLTDGDVELLNDENLPFNVMTYEYGWVVSTTSLMSVDLVERSVEEMAAAGLSQEFIAAARAAGERGCWLLRFDADADLEEDLPIGGGMVSIRMSCPCPRSVMPPVERAHLAGFSVVGSAEGRVRRG